MRKIELEQGSPEWLQWRKGLLTATDAPMLMGVSPYVTPYKGWQRKVGLADEQSTTAAMLRGREDEPIARREFIEEYGINMTPCCIESDKYNFCGASLDGISDCGQYILEVKSNGDHYHNNLDKGIPDFHMMQMQHQLLCTDSTASMGFYVSYNKGKKIIKEVYPDLDWLEDYLVKAKEFWKGVVFFEAPKMTQKDYTDMRSSIEWQKLATEYQAVDAQIKLLEEKKSELRKGIIDQCNEQNCFGSGVTAFRKISKGRVDYESIPELLNVDVEKYRKKSISSWTILVETKT